MLPHITPSIGFEPVPADQPLGDFLGSLAGCARCRTCGCCPRTARSRRRVHARVDELLAHHDHRLDQLPGAVQAEPGTAYEVARRLTWTRRERTLDDLDPFNAALATLETRAHLELLVARAR